MIGDITLLREGAYGAPGSKRYAVASGAVASIKAGELVLKALGAAAVTVWTASNTAKPVAGTDFIGGLSTSTSTDTAAAAGVVDLMPITSDMVFLIDADTAATWDTQSEYDALVGDRVLLKTSAAGKQTILATDGATSGLVIEPMDVTKYPGKVAFSVRAACIYNA